MAILASLRMRPAKSRNSTSHRGDLGLDEALLQKALTLSACRPKTAAMCGVSRCYPTAPANAPPQLSRAIRLRRHVVGGHVWGNMRAADGSAHDGHGVYCTTQQEDNATLNAMMRGAQSGLADLRRVATCGAVRSRSAVPNWA